MKWTGWLEQTDHQYNIVSPGIIPNHAMIIYSSDLGSLEVTTSQLTYEVGPFARLHVCWMIWFLKAQTYGRADKLGMCKACNTTTIRIRPEQMSVQSKQLKTMSVTADRLNTERESPTEKTRLPDLVPAPAVQRHTDSTTRREMYALKAQCALDRCVSLCVCVCSWVCWTLLLLGRACWGRSSFWKSLQ